MIHFIYGVGGELSTDTLDLQKDKLEGPRVNYAWNVTKDKNDKTEDVLLHDVLHHEKEGFFGKKTIMLGETEAERKNKYEMDCFHIRSHRHESTGTKLGC